MQGTSLKREQETLHYKRYLPISFPPLWFILGCKAEVAIYRTTLKETTEIITDQQIFHATNLHDTADDDTVNDLRRDLASSQRSSSSVFCQIGGCEALQQTSIGPERSSLRRNNEYTCNRSKNYPDVQSLTNRKSPSQPQLNNTLNSQEAL